MHSYLMIVTSFGLIGVENMLNQDEIKKIIPHREPFILIDTIEELEPGKRAVATKTVRQDEPYLKGHFPGMPVMPGVLVIEALAQTGAVAMLSLDKFKGMKAFFGGIQKARFRKQILPGDTMKLIIEITKVRGNMGIGNATAYVGEKKAVEAELTFALGN